MNLSASGIIQGVPISSRQQEFEFVLEVTDSGNPPQRVTQYFALSVLPSELRILLNAPPLKIVPSPQPPGEEIDERSLPRTSTIQKASYAGPAVTPHWVVPLQALSVAPTGKTAIAGTSSKASKSKPTDPIDPSTFIHIFEDTKTGKRWSLYEPEPKGQKRSLQLTADLDSSLVIVPDGHKMGDDPALNKLYMTAKLASGDTSKDIAVTGYAEIGKDKASMASQSGAAFQSAANVEAMIFNMAYTVGDILRFVYPASQINTSQPISTPLTIEEWLKQNAEIDFRTQPVTDIDKRIATAIQSNKLDDAALQPVRERFRLYQPEIQAISDFFVQKGNLEIVEKVGVEIFWIDRDSMERIAQQFKDNIQTAFDPKSTPQAQAQALQDLLERVKLVYKDFGDFRREIRDEMTTTREAESHTKGEWDAIFQEAILTVAAERRKVAFGQLKKLLATGSISLTANQAKDGDRLTLTVESVPADGGTEGIPVVFEITIKKYGAKIQWSPSLLFVRRLGVTDAEAAPATGSTATPLNRVNFAPSPGMTFGIAYFKRGYSSWDKFVRALGPGLGMNVTFMNYNDPSFNLATTQFTNTSGTDVQVGAGLIGSLFDNKLQLSYGWNLNVERRRTYFAVGFGFIEIGKEVAKYIAK
jgi:hypothetical protein